VLLERVKPDGVAFAVSNDGNETLKANTEFGFKDFSVVRDC
jgi:hypothetical protein